MPSAQIRICEARIVHLDKLAADMIRSAVHIVTYRDFSHAKILSIRSLLLRYAIGSNIAIGSDNAIVKVI
jgi:hypothetical protein